MLIFNIPVKPRGKARPRMSRNGHVYTPKVTRDAENEINQYVNDVLFAHADLDKLYPNDDEFDIEIIFFMPILKKENKSTRFKMDAGYIRYVKKPDLDNMIKLLLDALNGVLWNDDSQVFSIIASKRYSNDPRIVLKIL